VTTRKHEKLTKDELEERLFNLFGQQAHWHFTQIQVRLDATQRPLVLGVL
jgi:hypothetical protein